MTTTNKDTGGPAFPTTRTVRSKGMDRGGYPTAVVSLEDAGGMTLRDYFAGQALAAIVRDRDALRSLNGEPDYPLESNLSFTCYKIADAMLEARKQ